MSSKLASLVFVVSIALPAAPLHGAEGAFEINQDCAIAGCFAGDSAGFPVTIGAGGRYVLTSNLNVTTAVDAITVTALATVVSIDLAGHQMDGGGRCSGFPVSSCVFGTGVTGIDFNAAAGTMLEVRGGTIRGFGRAIFTDIHAAAGTTVEDMVITDSTASVSAITLGVSGTDPSVVNVRRTKLLRNFFGGLSMDTEIKSMLEDLIVVGNGVPGQPAVQILGQGSVVRSRFYDNGGRGLFCVVCAMGENMFSNNSGGDVNTQYTVATVRDMGGNVCADGTCP